MPAAAASRAAGRALLLRDYIAARLTAPSGGYFAAAAPPVGALAAPIPFGDLPSRSAYRDALASAYAALTLQGGAWLTPAELFTPHYGAALAGWMLSQQAGEGRVSEIVEAGGGTGTLACDVLAAIQAACPATYSGLTYASLDVSASLSAAAASKIRGAGHGPRHRAVVGDARDVAAWPPPPTTPGRTIILACEVLDNLPHDRVRPDGGGGWLEAVVECENDDASSVPTPLSERHRPAADPLILRVLQTGVPWSSGGGGGGGKQRQSSLLTSAVAWALGEDGAHAVATPGSDVWLPTGALALFDAAFAARPHHTLLAADFDALPGVALSGAGAPLVAASDAERGTIDLPSLYTLPPAGSGGATDIFFPIDFTFLARLYAAAGAAARSDGAAARHCSSASFFRAVLDGPSPTATLSGWDPMVDDFENTSVLVGRAGAGR